MTMYQCPRRDLDCQEDFRTTGDLDYHFRMAHGYRGVWRVVSSFLPQKRLPYGPEPERRIPGAAGGAPGGAIMGTGPSSTVGAVDSRGGKLTWERRRRRGRHAVGAGRRA
jgi:hypothetical protein